MKLLCFFIVIFLYSDFSFAQAHYKVNTVKGGLPYNNSGKPKGLAMRNAGRVMAISGGLLFIGGVLIWNNSDGSYYKTPKGTYGEVDPKAAVGTLMMGCGVGLAIPGIILWHKGNGKYRESLEQKIVVSYNGNINLAYRF